MMLMLIHLPLEDDFLKKQEIIIQLYSVNVTANEYLIGVDFSAANNTQTCLPNMALTGLV
jgi:hypothetical protein